MPADQGPYVIHDGSGFAYDDILEGPIWTILADRAKVFATVAEAKQYARQNRIDLAKPGSPQVVPLSQFLKPKL